jgi:predicted dinucleotide-utilizing enzyme
MPMEKQAKQKVVVIGCGHVAWHIAKHLASLKRFSLFVYNHEKNPLLTEFKTRLRCHTAVGLDKVIPDASVYVICVTDKYISELSGRLIIRNPNALLLHTSGSVPLQEISGRLWRVLSLADLFPTGGNRLVGDPYNYRIIR